MPFLCWRISCFLADRFLSIPLWSDVGGMHEKSVKYSSWINLILLLLLTTSVFLYYYTISNLFTIKCLILYAAITVCLSIHIIQPARIMHSIYHGTEVFCTYKRLYRKRLLCTLMSWDCPSPFFWPFLKWQKIDFRQKNFFPENDILFDFTSFFGLNFSNFLAHCG